MKNRRPDYDYHVPNPPEPGYQSLANVLIALAVSDLRLALWAKGSAARARTRELAQFLCDGRTARLTDLDLREIIRKVFEEYGADPPDYM